MEASQDHREFQSLYRYNTTLRKLILSVKIEGNHRSLACLSTLLLDSPRTQEAVRDCEYIMPAPSSLWSRVRGRVDLAWLLADSLAKKFALNVQKAPFRLHWEFSKRSKVSNRERVALENTQVISNFTNRVLIFDDVVTSGHTLRRVASEIPKTPYRFFTLASAFNKKRN